MADDRKSYFLGIPTGDTLFNSDHLTIKYFGKLEDDAVRAIKSQMDSVTTKAFPLESEGIGLLGRYEASLVSYIKPVDRLKELFDKWGADDAIPHITLAKAKPMVSGGIDTPEDKMATKIVLYRIDGERNYSPVHVKELQRRDPLTYFSDVLNLTKEGSVVSEPKQELNPHVWVDGKLNPELRKDMLEDLTSLFEPERIKEALILGSLTGYRYSDDSDVDVNVAIADLPDEKSKTHYTRDTINGQYIPGTQHDVNYFLQNWEEGYKENFQGLDFGVYDVIEDEWITPPNDMEKLPHKFTHQQDMTWSRMLAQELFRNLDRYKADTPDSSNAYQDLLDTVEGIDRARKQAYGSGWGVPRYSEGNMVFKMFEDKLVPDPQLWKKLLKDASERLYERKKT